MTNQSPMSFAEPWTLVSEGYVTDTKPIFRQYCEKAIELSGFNGIEKVLDVACGPGTLSLLLSDQAKEIHAIDFSQGMVDCFDREIEQQGISNIKTYLMDGQMLQFDENEFDTAFSIFGLMFFPDRMKGFKEMYRTLRPGGSAVVTSWAPISESTAMTLMFGAMNKAFPRKPESRSEKILNLESTENFKKEMTEAGFKDVTVTPFDGYWRIDNVEEFFDSMVRGSAPMAIMKSRMSSEEWSEKRSIMLEYIHSEITELPTSLNSRALIGVGRK